MSCWLARMRGFFACSYSLTHPIVRDLDQDARELGLPFLDEAAFFALVAAHDATKLRRLQSIKDGLIPDLANIVAGYAASPAEGIGAQWAEICGWLGIVNTPATEDEIAQAEARLQLAFPPYLKQLWRVAADMNCNRHYDTHPRDVSFPSVGEVVRQYEGEGNQLGKFASGCWKKFNMLPLSNHNEAGDRYKVIDLSNGVLLDIDFDHEEYVRHTRRSA